MTDTLIVPAPPDVETAPSEAAVPGSAEAESAPSTATTPAPPTWLDQNDPLRLYWSDPVWKVAAAPSKSKEFDPDLQWRYRAYALLTMALVYDAWNGNRYGPLGKYAGRDRQLLSDQPLEDGRFVYDGGTYLGHNIACIGVHRTGEIIDFDFNHNEIFHSSVEHAEARLVRRIYSLAQVGQGVFGKRSDGHFMPDRSGAEDYGSLLSEVTIFTSLESCAQCSGIMALGGVGEVAYLQHDPGTYLVGNALYNFTHPKPGQSGGVNKIPAPLPIPGTAFRLDYEDQLEDAYADFLANPSNWDPFFTRYPASSANPGKVKTTAVTAFLCTDAALTIFQGAAAELDDPDRRGPPDPGYAPTDANGNPVPDALTNQQVLAEVLAFRDYAKKRGYRGTPHPF